MQTSSNSEPNVMRADFESILCYKLCSQDVLSHLSRLLPRYLPMTPPKVQLPRRLFRSLVLRDPSKGEVPWSETDHPLPFLVQLYAITALPRPEANGHEGYALTRAVHARFTPLIRFLLANGADPGVKNGLAVMVAIRRKDLAVVKMLVERVDESSNEKGKGEVRKAKRRRLRDRVVVTNEMLRMAVKCDARDIVQYFREEKGLVPDLKTLSTLPAPAASPVIVSDVMSA